MRGLKWAVEEAEVLAADQFQDDEGQPKAYVKLAYFGGLSTIMVEPAELKKFQPHIGKLVSCSGALYTERKGNGSMKVKFELAEIKAK